MKKKIVLLLILLLTITVATTGCEKKKAITAEKFKKTMESKGYVIKDVNDQFEGQKVLKQVYLAIKADSSYQIEFYELTTTDAGKEFYKVNKENFEKAIVGKASKTQVNIGNYNKYTLNNAKRYKVIATIDNTGIYVNANEAYKKEVKKIIDELGY